MLHKQLAFTREVTFSTTWAQLNISDDVREAKIQEIEEFIEVLE